MKKIKSLVIKLLIYNFLKCVDSDEIFGCGGFVKSDHDINYSRVEVKLYTKHGSLKYHTDCAPHNGYYLIPVYDKGDYILKIEPPEGWNFEPNSVALHINGVSDPCSLNQDINFTFKGFTITGQVLSRNKKAGPAGLQILVKDSDKKTIYETSTVEHGLYTIPNLFPGKYSVHASHKTWLFDEAVESIDVTDNTKTANKIIIAGYDVNGFVYSDGQPIPGVYFLLFSESVKGVPKNCNAEKVKEFNSIVKETYLCYVTSSNEGKFTFPSVPPGNYKLVPFYKGEHIEFDVSPSEVDFVVTEDSLYLEQNFQIQGFSVRGWIGTGKNGKSVPGVSIYINNEIQGNSNDNGIYHLENMRAGIYKIEMKKDLLFFDPVEMKISPNTPRLPDVYVSKFAMCGHIEIREYPSGTERGDRKVIVKLENGEELVSTANVEGEFCFDVARGKYYVEPLISEMEKSDGLKFVPEKQIINIVDDPVLGIYFKQFRAEISGKVKCIDKCDSVVLELAPLSQDKPPIEVYATSDGSFTFENCLPGNYILSVLKDNWCFQSKAVKVTIIDKDVVDLELNQNGFQVVISLTHSSSLKIKYPSGESHSVDLQKSKNVLCLPEKGVYDFIPVGCHLYKKDIYKFDTNNPSEIFLTPIKHLVTGNILTELNVTDIKVFVKKQTSEAEDVISLQEPLEYNGKHYKYTFSVFVQPDMELEVRVASKHLLFHPVNPIKVQDDCLENAVEIIGKIGHFLNGSVTPPIEGVNIKIFNKENNLFSETFTDKEGKYLVGPLEDTKNFVIHATYEGYTFIPSDNSGNLEAFKLGKILVEVVNEDGEPLHGVLLSLSGSTGYRKNSITQSDGKLAFTGLKTDKYFLKPMLKEFSFDPPSKMIVIRPDVQVEIKIKGVRVAYSLYGTVTSLTGEAEVGIAVEALGIPSGSCSEYQEEAISEQGGIFRIRGLKPNCEYKLHLKPGADVNQHIERATPNEIPVKITNGDTTGVRLIVFRYYGQLDISGNVLTNQEYLPTLKVRLYKEEAPDQIVHSVILGQSSFFYLPSIPIDNKSYILELESSLSTNAFHYSQPSYTFSANTSFYHFTFKFNPQVKSVEQEVTQGSILALPCTVIVLLLAYNYTKFFNTVKLVFQLLVAFLNPNKTVNEHITEIVSTQRKARPKRI